MAKVTLVFSWSVLLLALVAVNLPSKATAAIPASCYSPSGADCSWYTTCLEAKIPCRGGSSDYAVAYADFYCNKYRQSRSSFSPDGQRWIDGVRKCLQVKLAPELSRIPSPTCSALKTKAIASHVPCYLNPPGAPSVCDISSDWTNIVNTVGLTVFKEISTSAQVGGTCILRIIAKFGSLLSKIG